MADQFRLPRLSPGRRAALAELDIRDRDGLLAWVARQLADAVNQRKERTRTRPADARRWIVAAVGDDARTDDDAVEHLDPSTQDGWDADATFITYFQHRDGAEGARRRVLVCHHDSDDDEQAIWPGTDCSQVGAWMRDRVTAAHDAQPVDDPAARPGGPVSDRPSGAPPSGGAADTAGDADDRPERSVPEDAVTPRSQTMDDRTAAGSGPAARRDRSIDGRDNGAPGRDVGRAGRPLRTLGLSRPDDHPGDRINPRAVSNLVCRQGRRSLDPWRRSEFVWAWGQFLDHELDLVHDRVACEPGDTWPIPVPDDDHRLEFRGTEIPFTRSERDLPNAHTAYVDASNVYGVADERVGLLREGRGGRLRVTATPVGDLPPRDDRDEPGRDCDDAAAAVEGPAAAVEAAERMLGRPMDASADDGGDRPTPRFFLAGDDRANEHPVLLSLHTVFLREHNWWCDELARRDPALDDERLFQEARRRVGAEMQAITYHEFLPALLGPDALPASDGFDPDVDPGISTLFATACYRLGHSMVRDRVVLGPDDYGLGLDQVFFAPEFVERLGVERWLWRLPYRRMQAVDPRVVDGLRDFLFRNRAGNGSQQMLDLAALNLQRGRDHGLPDFNACRSNEAFDLPHVADFDALTGDAEVASRLRKAYGSIDLVDPWVGALAEQPTEGRRVGALLHATLVDQFTRLRDGDAHWFEWDPHLDADDRVTIGRTRLGDVLRRTLGPIDGMPFVIPGDVFAAP